MPTVFEDEVISNFSWKYLENTRAVLCDCYAAAGQETCIERCYAIICVVINNEPAILSTITHDRYRGVYYH